MVSETMPAAFLGHGSPMNALEKNRYTEEWRLLGARAPRPRAILVISAHWFIGLSAVTAMARPRTIHDFYGFPDALFATQYPAPGSTAIAEEIAEAVKPLWIGLDHDSWGLDHGAWSVLLHAFPNADIPVIQLSINGDQPFEYHFELGAALAPLRQRGIFIVASGNVVHNLRLVDFNRPDVGFDWAHRFDDAVRDLMTSSPEKVITLRDHADFNNAVPTPEHFIPLLYLAGLANAARSATDVLIDGYAYGSLSMTAYTVGVHLFETSHDRAGSAPLPGPDVVPPRDTNT